MLSNPRIEVVFHSFRYATRRNLQGSCKDCYLRSHSFTQPKIRMLEPSHSSALPVLFERRGTPRITERDLVIEREFGRGAHTACPLPIQKGVRIWSNLLFPPSSLPDTCQFLEIPRVHYCCILYCYYRENTVVTPPPSWLARQGQPRGTLDGRSKILYANQLGALKARGGNPASFFCLDAPPLQHAHAHAALLNNVTNRTRRLYGSYYSNSTQNTPDK